jgi:hypothetical protein
MIAFEILEVAIYHLLELRDLNTVASYLITVKVI